MYVNSALSKSNHDQCDILRREWFPGKSQQQIKDSYINAEAITRFYAVISPDNCESTLRSYIQYDRPSETSERNQNIKEDTFNTLKKISNTCHLPLAQTWRLILLFWQIQLGESECSSQDPIDFIKLKLKVTELSQQIAELNESLKCIKELLSLN